MTGSTGGPTGAGSRAMSTSSNPYPADEPPEGAGHDFAQRGLGHLGGSSGVAFVHVPVMVAEIVEVFAAIPPGLLLDATVGGGGHALAVLATHAHLRVLALDRDLTAVTAARARLAEFDERATVIQSRFDEVAERVDSVGVTAISGFLFDLGVSSPQLDDARRGFSYRAVGPLDMRMDPQGGGTTAAELVNGLDIAALAGLLERFGDERHAMRIARAIVAARPVTTTATLADIVRDAIPAPARRRGGHPAKRTFQALRIAVNDELGQLPIALDAAVTRLAPGGRGAVLSYHSGEDRLVKACFNRAAGLDLHIPRGLPVEPGAGADYRILWRGSRSPSDAECRTNRRAESARLRVIERRVAD